MSKPGGDPSSGISSVDVVISTERHPACRQREARSGCRTERENLRCVTPPAFHWWREATKPQTAPTARARVPTRCVGTEQPVVATKRFVMELERRAAVQHL